MAPRRLGSQGRKKGTNDILPTPSGKSVSLCAVLLGPFPGLSWALGGLFFLHKAKLPYSPPARVRWPRESPVQISRRSSRHSRVCSLSGLGVGVIGRCHILTGDGGAVTDGIIV